MSQASNPPQFVLPGAQLTVPQPDPMFPVAHGDWKRLRRRVESLSDPIAFAANMMWAAISIAASAGLALIPWLAAYSQLPSDGQLSFSWVTPTLAIASIASLAIAVLAGVMNSRVQGGVSRSAAQLVEDMDDVYARYGAGSPAP